MIVVRLTTGSCRGAVYDRTLAVPMLVVSGLLILSFLKFVFRCGHLR